ncbi:MAG: hypothetical protein WD207_07005, partial [Xanthobacteraceae bacterium]
AQSAIKDGKLKVKEPEPKHNPAISNAAKQIGPTPKGPPTPPPGPKDVKEIVVPKETKQIVVPKAPKVEKAPSPPPPPKALKEINIQKAPPLKAKEKEKEEEKKKDEKK